MSLSLAQIQQFKIDGYLVLPNALESAELKALNQLTKEYLEQRIQPFELEADVNYPGAPSSINEPGGQTIRRLNHKTPTTRLSARRGISFNCSKKRNNKRHPKHTGRKVSFS